MDEHGEITEDQCSVCSAWPKADREANRLAIKELPSEGACILCWQALFDNRQKAAEGKEEQSVPEDQCVICSAWPAADRADRRREHFLKDDYIAAPMHGVCKRCEMTFWANLAGVEYTDAELEEALRQEAPKIELRLVEVRPRGRSKH